MTFGTREILVFEAGGRLFGLGIEDVERVLPALRPVPLPQSAAGFQGIVNLHGDAITVIDLRAWFGDSAREVRVDDLLIVLRAGKRRVALHVERALGVTAISQSDVQPAQRLMPSARHFAGVVMIEGGIVFLPDVPGFISAAENLGLAEASAA
ncbi:MAG TPA: chemotaxis protein CheW [Rhizomicrobium sp.]